MMTGDTPVLQVRHVTARYPGSAEPALHDCSLALQPGEHVAVLGLNGSGKTTVLLSIVGLVPIAGEIVVEGVPLMSSTLQDVRSRIGFLFSTPEDQLLFPRVLDDVAYSLLRKKVAHDDALARAQQALDMLAVGDLAGKGPYELSHGQRLRVALAGVLVARPGILLLDEATSALDPPGRRALGRLLRETPSALLFATHDLDAAERCCDRFLLMENGAIAADTRTLSDIRHRIDRDAPP